MVRLQHGSRKVERRVGEARTVAAKLLGMSSTSLREYASNKKSRPLYKKIL